MEALSFRQFIADEPYITVEEIGPLLENEILGHYEDGYRKYRVTFHAPKNKRAWKVGDFSEDIVYVLADSPHTAKRMAHDWIVQRLEPREDQERPKRVPKSNYLRSTEKRHFDLRSRIVGSWRQVVEMLGFAADRRQHASDFIDEPELEILVDALSGRAKQRLINSLSEPERKGVRQLLASTKKNPAQWSGHHGKKAAQLAQELTVMLWPRRGPDPFGDVVSEPEASFSGYRNSIYRRKLSQKDVRTIMARVESYKDVIREANRLGISKPMLDQMVSSRYEHEDQEYEEKRKVFADLYKRLRIPSSHNIFGSDHQSKYWHQKEFDWEGYATEVLPAFGLTSIKNAPGHGSNYEDNSEYTHNAVEWLWDLYRAGPPRRSSSQAQRYRDALEQILTGHMEEKKTKSPASVGDLVPF